MKDFRKGNKLPGLNGLRALAASLVLVSHVFQISAIMGVAEGAKLMDRVDFGGDMVNLFFVLSGFIITYTLIKEENKTGTISIKNFYAKRFLRIWPIYFLLLIIVCFIGWFTNGFGGFPDLNSKSVFIVSLFLVNFNYFFQFPLSVIGHYWSLSVEEQFYLFWPLIFKKFDIGFASLFIILSCFVIRNGADYLAFHGGDQKFWQTVWRVMDESKFGSLAIGVLGAVIATNHHKNKIVIVFHPLSQLVVYSLFFASLIFTHTRLPLVESESMAFIYLLVILNVAFNSSPVISFENRFLDHLGKISYGIYMYHWPIIVLLIVALKTTPFWTFATSFYLLPLLVLAFALTYVTAFISFTYFESIFLRWKPKINGKLPESRLNFSVVENVSLSRKVVNRTF